ncbi:MAG: DUF4249 domain-containing protein [Muribaculaceae bacterium]|nr:DUF4249 domain-containing protein [Muribaculaceae bacterium]
MAILNRLYPLIPALLLTGCYHDFIPEMDTEPVLCINSLITAGEPVAVELSHTWLYTDGDAAGGNVVDDAAVRLFANGIPVQSDYIPQEGDLIRIEASSRRYGDAWAEVVVPETARATVLEAEPRLTRVGQYEGTGVFAADVSFDLQIRLAVDDISGTDNYFHYSCDGCIENDSSFADTDGWESYFSTGSFKYEAEPIFAEHIGVLESVTGSDDGDLLFSPTVSSVTEDMS